MNAPWPDPCPPPPPNRNHVRPHGSHAPARQAWIGADAAANPATVERPHVVCMAKASGEEELPAVAGGAFRSPASESVFRAGARVVLLPVLALLVGAVLVGAATAAAGAGLPLPVKQALDRHRLPESSLSVWVQDTAAKTPFVRHRPDVPRNPASTAKLPTTFAALEMLGPDYDWETGVYVTGPVRNGRLEGDLVLVGSGDPFLVTEQLWRLLAAVQARGLRQIAGRIVIDNTHFSVAGEPGSGEFDGKPFRVYNALPDALLVNFNSLDVVVEAAGAARGGAVRGRDARVRVEPPVAGLRVRDRLDLVRGGCARARFRIDVSGSLSVASPLSAPLPEITVGGRLPRGCSGRTFRRSLLPPVRFAEGVIRALWTQMGGRIEGGFDVGRLPPGATRWYRHHSPPLSFVIRGINKFSNNVMARNVLLTLGAERFGPPGTVDKGRRAVAEWLRKRGYDLPHLHLANGSGLSRETRMSARGLAGVLIAAERSRFRPEFAQSLPIASLDGTMKKRLRRHPGAEWVRVKTGLLNNVRAMAGYVRTRRGRTFAVVALQNHPGVHQGGRGTAVQDALLRWLLDR